jgi:hypothetical protein
MSGLGLFNLSANKNSEAKGFEEGVHYKIIKDGNGLEYRIINFENTDLCPREGLIELEPLNMKNKERHRANVNFRIVRDKEMDVIVGIPLSIDPKTKQLVFEKITLEGGETLDLSIPKEAMKWACIKRSHFFTDVRDGVEMNKNFQAGSKTKYKAVDKERENLNYIKQRQIKRKAVDIAEGLFGSELEDFALSIGINPKVMSPMSLSVEVIKFSESNAAKFMEVWNSSTREEMSILKRGLSVGVLRQDLDKGINYNGLTLGFNEPEAIKYLSDHPATKLSIDTLSRKSESNSKVAMSLPDVVAPAIKDEKDAEIERLRKALANAEKNAANANEVAIELQSNFDLQETDPELAELIKEAKSLDIRGVHNMKDKEKIRQKIAEKKELTKN